MKHLLRKAAIAIGGGTIALGALSALPANAAQAPTHVPNGNLEDTNWAGYYAVPANGKGPETVFTQFTVPRARCYNVIGRYPAAVSMWAGIGGMDDVQNGKKAWLEQAGIQIRCPSKNSAPIYEPFAETVAGTDNVEPLLVLSKDTEGKPRTIKPGDHISVSVQDNSFGRTKKFGMNVSVNGDGQNGYSFFRQMYVPSTAYTGRTAEVMTEYPTQVVPNPKQLDWFTMHELGTKVKVRAGGVIVVGSVRYSNSAYLTHLKGDVKPRGVAVTQHKIRAVTNPTWNTTLGIYPSVSFPTIPGNPGFKDGFFTYYR